MEKCSVGKDFNPKTCRYINSCKPGYKRDKDFKCVRDSAMSMSRSIRHEKQKLLKELFSNSRSNARSNVEPTEPLPGSLAHLKQTIYEVVKGIGPSIKQMTYGETKMIARSRGLELKSRKEKTIFRDSIHAYKDTLPNANVLNENHNESQASRASRASRAKFKSGKKSKKALSAIREETRPPSPNFSPPKESNSPQKKSFVSEPPKVTKSKKSFVSEFPDVRPKPKSVKVKPKLTKDQKEKLINLFLNKIGLSIKHIPWERVKELAQNDGLLLDSAEYRSIFNRLLQEYVDSYDTMTLKSALVVMNVDETYTMDDLLAKYKEKSLEIFPDKPFNEKKETLEFQRMENAFNLLKERLKNNNFKHTSIDFPSHDEIMNIDKMNLFSEDTVFLFYSKSSDTKPGKGAGEIIPPGQEDKFDALSKIKDWRKKLSNFWIQPFDLDGKRWQSVEHYYQGSKFKGTPNFYNQFSLDSGSDISKDPALAKGAGGKSGTFGGKLVRPKEIKLDDGFFDRNKIEMYKAQHAKFTQHDDLMKLLKLTKDAKLMHFVRGSPNIAFYNLMYIRSKL